MLSASPFKREHKGVEDPGIAKKGGVAHDIFLHFLGISRNNHTFAIDIYDYGSVSLFLSSELRKFGQC